MNKGPHLVLGAKGFIGSHLVDALLSRGIKVRAFDRAGISFLGGGSPHREGLETLEGDFSNAENLSAAVDGCHTCFHLVSTTVPSSADANPIGDVESNLLGTLRLLDQAVRHGVRKVVFLSSGGAVYGQAQSLPIDETHPTHPLGAYGISKLTIEKYLALYHRLHGLDYCVLRAANIYGERQRTISAQGAVAVFMGRAMNQEAIQIWGDGASVRDYLHVQDLVRAMSLSSDYGGDKRVINIGSGRGTGLTELVEKISAIANRKLRTEYRPSRTLDVSSNVLDIRLAEKALGWSPEIPLEAGLARTWAHLLGQAPD